jgi:hypothetical protein
MLSDEDSMAIGTWIAALFDGDGISDDLVRYGLPHSFGIFARLFWSLSWGVFGYVMWRGLTL